MNLFISNRARERNEFDGSREFEFEWNEELEFTDQMNLIS